ncbi:hypothetical protein [Phormidium sp. CCY1219]|nr:hypothetical protein [Phormidium sp. CCY1219]MEB3830585.1 hypothetical protein [Phormidium sp. CCY1219]
MQPGSRTHRAPGDRRRSRGLYSGEFMRNLGREIKPIGLAPALYGYCAI